MSDEKKPVPVQDFESFTVEQFVRVPGAIRLEREMMPRTADQIRDDLETLRCRTNYQHKTRDEQLCMILENQFVMMEALCNLLDRKTDKLL